MNKEVRKNTMSNINYLSNNEVNSYLKGVLEDVMINNTDYDITYGDVVNEMQMAFNEENYIRYADMSQTTDETANKSLNNFKYYDRQNDKLYEGMDGAKNFVKDKMGFYQDKPYSQYDEGEAENVANEVARFMAKDELNRALELAEIDADDPVTSDNLSQVKQQLDQQTKEQSDLIQAKELLS